MNSKNIFLSVISLMVAVFSAATYAASYHDPGSCSTISNGTVQCKGVYSDMALNTNIDYVYFMKSYNSQHYSTSLTFYMVYNGRYYSCSGGDSMLSAWDSLMASRNGDFVIKLDPNTGVCLSLTVYSSTGTM